MSNRIGDKMKLKEDKIKLFIRYLKENNKTISTMESCTGGYIANVITNVIGASEVFKLGIVTYSNETKIIMGVSEKIIDKYTVYSKEVAYEMAFEITKKANSDYGIGVTGIINSTNEVSLVYICIYDANNKKANYYTISADMGERQENKIILANFIFDRLFELCKLA